MMIWRELLDRGAATLENAGVEDAKVNAEYLAAHALSLKHKSDLRPFLDRQAELIAANIFHGLIHRREKREPLQYILGEWEFYGLPMKITPSALIPRPETEILVEESLREAARFDGPISILDIGTGSGAIALALASKLPKAQILGIDSSAEALALAEENRKRLHFSNIKFARIDIGRPGRSDLSELREKFEIVVSNPPYISLKEFETLDPELRLYEPREALTDESTGLTFYERMASFAPKILMPEGKLLVEFGYGAEEGVSEIMRSQGLRIIRVVMDLAGIPRVLIVALNGI